MARNPTIVSLFDKYGFVVRWTDPDAHPKNYPAEGLFRYIGEAVRYLI